MKTLENALRKQKITENQKTYILSGSNGNIFTIIGFIKDISEKHKLNFNRTDFDDITYVECLSLMIEKYGEYIRFIRWSL